MPSSSTAKSSDLPQLRELLGRALEGRGSLIGLVAVVIFAIVAAPGFLSVANIRNVLSENAPTGIVALAMTFLLLTRDFDLSVGGIYAISAVEFATIANGHGVLLATFAALGIGLLAGLVNGIIVVGIGVNSFIATLGTGSIFTGLAYQLAHNTAIFVAVPGFTTLGAGRVAGIPYCVILLVALAAVGAVVLRSTVTGRHIYAIGGSPEAARLAGVKVFPIRLALFSVVGLSAALGGIVFTSQIGVGQATIGTTLALDAIAIVVVGGTSLFGGEGGVVRTLIGLLILAVLGNAFNALALNSSIQLIVKGMVLVFAVAADAANLHRMRGAGIVARLQLRRRRARPLSSEAVATGRGDGD